MEKAGNDLKDASVTVTSIGDAARNLKARIEQSGMTIYADGYIQNTNPSKDNDRKVYDTESYRLKELAADTLFAIESTYDELVKIDDVSNGPRPEVANAGNKHPDPSWTPGEVNDWWTSLTYAEQQDIIKNHPGWLGNRAGIPSTVRDEANRKWLEIMVKDIGLFVFEGVLGGAYCLV